MTSRLFLPALQGRFGDWLYYTALVSLSDLKSRVGYAREIHKNTLLSDYIQRRLDDRKRKAEIAEFLLENNDRFFSSVVVGVYGGEPQWHPLEIHARTATHSLEDIREADREAVGYLELTGSEKLFALDGQHRLAGIREALDREPSVAEDRISVIFVSHKNSKAGLIRTRNLFIMLNKRAVAVKKPDIIALDEIDLAAIITRRLVDQHDWFCNGQIDFDRHGNSLPKGDRTHLTTLVNLYEVIRIAIPKVMDPEETKELKVAERVRLAEERIAHFCGRAVEFFDRLSKVDPLVSQYFRSPDRHAALSLAREPSAPHLLFRPIGLLILTRVLADLRRSTSLASAFKKLASAPMLMTESPYRDVIWDSSKENIIPKGASLAQRLLTYMLGGSIDASKLRTSYAQWLNRSDRDIRLPKKIDF